MMTTKLPAKNEKLDPKSVEEAYKKRLAWAMTFKEVLPTILRIGAEEGASAPEHIGLADMRWYDMRPSPFGYRIQIGHITLTLYKPGVTFRVGPMWHISSMAVAATPLEVEDVARTFFKRMNEESQRLGKVAGPWAV